jgi:hypothetical protein
MKIYRSALILALGLCLTGSLLAQTPADMVGTWVGMATLEGMAEPNQLTLVIELKEGKLQGHMSDEYGTMSASPFTEAKLAEKAFNFSVTGSGPGGQEITLVFEMTVDGDSMTGTFEVPGMGMNGTWESSKQK